MAAFNWILFDAVCPQCGSVSLIRCQTHIASDYSGDASGRFHDRTYHFGERMAWWPEADPRYSHWAERCVQLARRVILGGVLLGLYNCKAKLCAVIRFIGFMPTDIIARRTRSRLARTSLLHT